MLWKQVQLNWKLSNFPPLPNSLEVVVGVAGIVTGENADGSELDDSTVLDPGHG